MDYLHQQCGERLTLVVPLSFRRLHRTHAHRGGQFPDDGLRERGPIGPRGLIAENLLRDLRCTFATQDESGCVIPDIAQLCKAGKNTGVVEERSRFIFVGKPSCANSAGAIPCGEPGKKSVDEDNSRGGRPSEKSVDKSTSSGGLPAENELIPRDTSVEKESLGDPCGKVVMPFIATK